MSLGLCVRVKASMPFMMLADSRTGLEKTM